MESLDQKLHHKVIDSVPLEVQGRDENEDGRMVDWLGRAAAGRKLGGWRSSGFILGGACCGYFAFAGIFLNLVLYLIRVWHQSNAGAANNLTNVLGTLLFTSLIGGFLGDAYWGRLWTAMAFLLMFTVGTMLLAMAATLRQHAAMTNGLQAFLMLALYITALGNGSYIAVLASLGGDQFETPQEKAAFFNWFFVFSNIGQFLALTVLTYFENSGKWALGFWICGAALVLAVVLFVLSAPKCRQYRPGGNPFVRILQVLVSATRKSILKRVKPEAGLHFYEVEGEESVIPGCRKLRHTNGLRWLDKAATVTEEDMDEEGRYKDAGNSWKLCTVTEVEEMKCVIRVIPVIIAAVIFSTMLAQMTTLFVEQGATMDTRLGNTNFRVPPGSMQIFVILASIVSAPAYEFILVPRLTACTLHPKGISSLQRIAWGLVISMLAMIVAALVEMKRLQLAHNITHGPASTSLQAVPMSIFWLLPQNFLVGLAQVFASVGQLDFFYTELSDGMRSLGISMPFVCFGLGNYVSTLLVTVVTHITTHNGKDLGWIPMNLNQGHVDYFYWLLAALLLGALIFLLICTHSYTYLQAKETQNEAHENDASDYQTEGSMK